MSWYSLRLVPRHLGLVHAEALGKLTLHQAERDAQGDERSPEPMQLRG